MTSSSVLIRTSIIVISSLGIGPLCLDTHAFGVCTLFAICWRAFIDCIVRGSCVLLLITQTLWPTIKQRSRGASKAKVNSDDYYEVLGVSRKASKKEIKKAYRTLALKVEARISLACLSA